MKDITQTIQDLNKLYPKGVEANRHHKLDDNNMVEVYKYGTNSWEFTGKITIKEHNEFIEVYRKHLVGEHSTSTIFKK